jgi:hypothetical protein
MIIQYEPRDRDYWLYPVEVVAGANQLLIGATTVTIPAGWYYQGFSADADYPGLWSVIEAGAPAGTTLHVCTPTKSSGQISCGVEFRNTSSLTIDTDITNGIPRSLLGWTTDDKTGTSLMSDRNLPGVWRSNNLLDGIASVKDVRGSQVAFRSHRGPYARLSRWEEYTEAQITYEAVPAVYARTARTSLMSYTCPHGVDIGDEAVAFEPMWRTLTRGKLALIVPDSCTRPASIAGLVSASWGESGLESVDDVTRRESTAQERYTIDFGLYLREVVS